MLYFAYGAKMDTETLAAKGIRFEKVINGRARDYRLVFHKPGEDGTGRADLQDDRGSVAEGVVWEIPDEDLVQLEVAEDQDKGHYARRDIVVQTSRGELACVTHRATKFRTGLKPDREYLGRIIRGAENHGLSTEYLTFLRSHATA
jgi:gamma-glutamylcyclotransferase